MINVVILNFKDIDDEIFRFKYLGNMMRLVDSKDDAKCFNTKEDARDYLNEIMSSELTLCEGFNNDPISKVILRHTDNLKCLTVNYCEDITFLNELSDEDIVKISRTMSYILRFNPKSINVEMDRYGWVNVKDFIKGYNENNKFQLNIDILNFIVRTDEKQRYSFNAGHSKIRANQGHSKELNVKIDSIKFVDAPPFLLYHGTTQYAISKILRSGLKPMNRQYVHLTDNLFTALTVGKRRKNSTIGLITVNTTRAIAAGVKFYRSENGVWLTKDTIPPECLNVDN